MTGTIRGGPKPMSMRQALRRAWLTACIPAALLSADRTPPPGRVVFEAEHCREMTYPWQPARAAGAAGGLSLTLPEGAGSSEAMPRWREGYAWFDLPIPVAGTYELWLRVLWHGNCSNSLYATLDDTTVRDPGITSQTMQQWHWLKAMSAELSAGQAELQLLNREDGVWVDQICLQPEGAPVPEGILPSNTALPTPASSTPSVTQVVRAGDAGVEPLPPTDFLLHHKRTRTQPISPQPTLVVTPGTQSPLHLWIRVNRTQGLPARCRLETTAPVTIRPRPEISIALEDTPLKQYTFTVRSHPDMARGITPMTCRLITADGCEQVKEVTLLRPYRWRLSQALRFNPKAGITQREELDNALLSEHGSGTEALQWRLLQPSRITPFGLVDLRAATAGTTYAMAYAATEVHWDRAETVCLDVMHDDWIRVWLNGREVFRSDVCAPATLTRELVRVNIRKGNNTLLVKSFQFKNYWEFSTILRPLDSVRGPVKPWKDDQ